MNSTKQSFHYKQIYPWLKWVFSALCVYFFVSRLQTMDASILDDAKESINSHFILFGCILLLALVNWNAEAQKFKLLLASDSPYSNLKLFLTILGGMAISNFTPARTGEYIGRSLLLRKIHPAKVIIATIAGNIAQVMMTYGVGLLCIVVLLLFTDMDTPVGKFSQWGLAAVFLVVALIFIWQKKRWYTWLKAKLPIKIARTLKLVKKYDRKLYLKVVGIAFLRYTAFTLQFYLLIQLFSEMALPISAILLVPVAYLMQSVAPVPAIADVEVRVHVSNLLFGQYIATDAIVLAVTSLWFINLILPGLIGTLYLVISAIRHR